ncbi:glycosyl transferase family 90-domain-containing protein [Mycena sp. CBHHK59/15]|nr:glycosyl transferase family 90-domain-containing protein [Mycena sp. CBHHK59/15]
MRRTDQAPWRQKPTRLFWRYAFIVVFALGAIAFLVRSIRPAHRHIEDETFAPSVLKPPPGASATPDLDDATADLVRVARARVDVLIVRQSRTLAQAVARYTLKAGRPSPPNFDRWFAFAREKGCLIDDYDQIHRDFEPFYRLAKVNPAYFQDMIHRGRTLMLQDSLGMTTIKIMNGEVQMPKYHGTPYYNELPRTLRKFASFLPDMDFLLNGRDEPRVVFSIRNPTALGNATKLKDTNAFHIVPHPTADFFKNHSGCSPSSTTKGFAADGSEDIAFLRSSSSSDFTTDFWPLLSMTKISPCFSDIRFPGQYYYQASRWSAKVRHPNDVSWSDKQPRLYWRGTSNGGHITGENYHKFPRFRLIDIARNHSGLIDAKMTRFAEGHCTDDCDRHRIIKEYDITGPWAPREDMYHYKYLLDVDGNTFSGRFLSLLKSGSLVFKSTVFEEYFNDWILPYQHYVPVKPDLSDLVKKIQWAIAHEEEVRLIQETGRQFTERVMTDAQNDCYFARVLLEWARLQSYANPTAGL